jgi:hypothetical protein
MTDRHSKPGNKETSAKGMADPYPPVDVCCGGTIPVGQNYVPLVNSTGASQTVSCALWGGVAVVVLPGSQTKNVPLTIRPLPPQGSSYSLTSTCNCPNETNPVIKVE